MRRASPVPTIDVVEAHRRLADELGEERARPLLVDVRERDEFSAVRVPGAVLVPLSEFAESSERLPHDRPLLVMCAAGRRSLVASLHLAERGYDVTNVEGGIGDWRRHGYPTTSGPPPEGEGDLERGA